MATQAENEAYEAAYQVWRNAEQTYNTAIDDVLRGKPPDAQHLDGLARELQRAHDAWMEKSKLIARPILRR